MRWLPLLAAPRTDNWPYQTPEYNHHFRFEIWPHHADVLRGLCWIAQGAWAQAEQQFRFALELASLALTIAERIIGKDLDRAPLPETGAHEIRRYRFSRLQL